MSEIEYRVCMLYVADRLKNILGTYDKSENADLLEVELREFLHELHHNIGVDKVREEYS